MKTTKTTRTTKLLLTLALAFFIAGAALGIASLSAGFSYREFVQNMESGRFTLIGPGERIWKTLDGLGVLQGEAGGGKTFTQTYTGVRALRLKAGQADCEIIPCDGSEWKVEGGHLTSRFECKLDDEKLCIDCGSPLLSFMRSSDNAVKLTLYVPQDQILEKVDIEAGVGTVAMEEDGAFLSCDELDLECGVGEINLCADIREKAKIEGGVGEVCVTLAGKEEDFNYKAQYGIGSVTIDGEEYSGLGGRHKADNGAKKDVKIECGVGEVELMFKEDETQSRDQEIGEKKASSGHHDEEGAEPVQEYHEGEAHSDH